MSTVVVTVSDGIIKKKREDNTNSNSYYSHSDYDRYSNKEKDYSPDLENDDDDDGQEAATTTTADSSNNPSTATKEQEEQSSLYNKRILLVDDEPDITLTYKSALEGVYDDTGDGDSKKTRTKFEVHAYNDPLEALLNFKPNFYDLLLIDINLPNMNGFELCEKLLKMDINMRVCFVSAGEVNEKAIREIHPSINIGCFIKKPVSMEDLVKRIKTELE
ncbi:MAG TPA: response regulator [Nitrososphaeraceae archaeon]|nr:response regulator [Nitrososphaeraceae archaeon]